jgi:hypothetical protein
VGEGEGLGDGLGEGLGEALGVAETVGLGVALGFTVGVGVGVGVVTASSISTTGAVSPVVSSPGISVVDVAVGGEIPALGEGLGEALVSALTVVLSVCSRLARPAMAAELLGSSFSRTVL